MNFKTSRAEYLSDDEIRKILSLNRLKDEYRLEQYWCPIQKRQRYKQIFETIDKIENWHDVFRVTEYLQKVSRKPLVIAGARGIGKTLIVRAALLEMDMISRTKFLIYKKNRMFEELYSCGKNPDILVIDDIHYIYDDYLDGNVSEDEFFEILEQALLAVKKLKRVIFIAEDTIGAYPFKSMRFAEICKDIDMLYDSYDEPRYWIQAPNMDTICKTQGLIIQDKPTEDFLKRVVRTPRSLINIANTCEDLRFGRLVTVARQRLYNIDNLDEFVEFHFGRFVLRAWQRGDINYRKIIYDLIAYEGRDMPEYRVLEIAKDLHRKLGNYDKRCAVGQKIKDLFRNAGPTGRDGIGKFYVFAPLSFALFPEWQEGCYLDEIRNASIIENERIKNQDPNAL